MAQTMILPGKTYKYSSGGKEVNGDLRLMTTIQINPNELSDKRVLVTGGTKGMGEAMVNRLRQAGATVITTARSKPDELRSPDLFIQSDISTPDGVEKVVKEVFARLGGVDILINNVGGSSAPSGGDRDKNFHSFVVSKGHGSLTCGLTQQT
jgi:NADPH:quinone reductase-like Zn-dependent oxidoreductase